MIHRYNTIFRKYNYSKNTYKIETREASLVSSYCMIIKTRFHGENINIVCTRSTYVSLGPVYIFVCVKVYLCIIL